MFYNPVRKRIAYIEGIAPAEDDSGCTWPAETKSIQALTGVLGLSALILSIYAIIGTGRSAGGVLRHLLRIVYHHRVIGHSKPSYCNHSKLFRSGRRGSPSRSAGSPTQGESRTKKGDSRGKTNSPWRLPFRIIDFIIRYSPLYIRCRLARRHPAT